MFTINGPIIIRKHQEISSKILDSALIKLPFSSDNEISVSSMPSGNFIGKDGRSIHVVHKNKKAKS
jgi:hypothetical protein